LEFFSAIYASANLLWRTGVIFSTSSLFGIVVAFLVLQEALTIIQIIAGTIMVLGIYVLFRCGETKPNPL
jgi:drug/metabolite transporter (DMT)-like permease